MPQIYLANAAFKKTGYDLEATVTTAAREHFAGVQLYIGEGRQNDLDLLDRVSRAARRAQLPIIAHLPPSVTDATVRAVRRVLQFQPQPRAIAHFDPSRAVPEIPGVQVGLENAIPGLDPSYYERLLAECRARSTFLAFDAPRLFGRRRADLASIYAFAHKILDGLTDRDVLHLIDQRRLGGRRADWCVLGRGLLAPLLPRLAAHRGPLILEFETLHYALASHAALDLLERT